MVAKITSGKTIRGVLNYNEQKVKSGKAELLTASKFIKDPDDLTYQEKLDRFLNLLRQNERTKTNAVHISLNFDKADDLDRSLLQQIAEAYMDKIGFGNQPFLVYQHYDAAHQHVHIVSTNIEEGGNRISLHDIGKNQSEAARKQIEIDFKLVKAESKKISDDYYLKPIDLQKAEYGKSETKAAISNIVREVVKSYKYTSLAELNAALRQFNVTADPGEPGTIKHDKKGLTYSLLDKEGNKVGVPIKASTIYGRPIISNLEKRFATNEITREDFKKRIQYILNKTLDNPAIRNKTDFAATLRASQVAVIWRENKEGRLYGITYVDNATRTVFNGSDLGKAFSANAIGQRLNSGAGDKAENTAILSHPQYKNEPDNELLKIMTQLLDAGEPADNMDYQLKYTRKKKKKKGKSL